MWPRVLRALRIKQQWRCAGPRRSCGAHPLPGTHVSKLPEHGALLSRCAIPPPFRWKERPPGFFTTSLALTGESALDLPLELIAGAVGACAGKVGSRPRQHDGDYDHAPAIPEGSYLAYKRSAVKRKQMKWVRHLSIAGPAMMGAAASSTIGCLHPSDTRTHIACIFPADRRRPHLRLLGFHDLAGLRVRPPGLRPPWLPG